MSYAIYNQKTNKILSWVTEPRGGLPDGWEFRAQADVPSSAMHEDPAQPVNVPQEAAMWALKELCLVRGHAADIEAALNSLPDPPRTIARNRWENKDTISRNSPIIAQMQALLGWSNAYVDELFIAADTLTRQPQILSFP